ncbi:MAG: hypothetical protein GXY55_07950 [Phycisphaerae bacterium]|nr:hypothetical protein [Phycisphaerae bacterium]
MLFRNRSIRHWGKRPLATMKGCVFVLLFALAFGGMFFWLIVSAAQ